MSPAWADRLMRGTGVQLEEGYKTDRGSGSGTTVGYSVEVRSRSQPTFIDGNMIGEKWTRLEFPRGEKGVPVPGCYDSSGQMAKLGLFSYQSAQAIRWWFQAAAENDFIDDATPIRIPMPRPWAIETRLVRHEIKYQYTVTATSAHEVLEDMSAPPKEPEPKPKLTDEQVNDIQGVIEEYAGKDDPDAKRIMETLQTLWERAE